MEKESVFLQNIVKEIVDNPDAVEVLQEVDNQGIKLTLKVDQADMGKVIGSKGTTASSLRTILRSFGGKHNAKLALIIEEPGEMDK